MALILSIDLNFDSSKHTFPGTYNYRLSIVRTVYNAAIHCAHEISNWVWHHRTYIHVPSTFMIERYISVLLQGVSCVLSSESEDEYLQTGMCCQL